MYNAPAVSFAVDRSLFAACALGLMWVVGAIASASLAALPSQPVWLPLAATALGLVVGLAALCHWRNLPVGTLGWDRKQWTFNRAGADAELPMPLNDIAVHLDFQRVMLVSFRPPTGQRLWFWLENRQHARESERLWRVLRRAIHARPRDKDEGSGQRPKRLENSPA